MSNINTDQWNKNSLVMQESLLAKTHRSLIVKLSRFYELVQDKQALVLDVGCGSGYFIRELHVRGYQRLYGIEPDADLVANIPAGLAEVRYDKAGQISFPDATFDAVFIYGVLHHLPGVEGYIEAAGEIDRILKPQGRLFIMEPGCLWMLRTVEYMTHLFGPVSPALRALGAALEEERAEQEFFIKNHAVLRNQFMQLRYRPLVDRYFLYTWIFAAGKSPSV